jgi:RimJ/RimL family protein N-acetyltransferase
MTENILTISGVKTVLKAVEFLDANAICELRNNEANNKFLSSQRRINVKQQEYWLKVYYSQKDGEYFMIRNLDSKTVGTISLYNVVEDSAEFGRYICNNPINAIESEYLLLKYGFESLNLSRIYCKTVMANSKVWNQHIKFGFNSCGEELDSRINQRVIIQEISKKEFKAFDYSWIHKLLIRFK